MLQFCAGNVFIKSFNNRELALVFWLAVLIVVLLSIKSTRKSLAGMLAILVSRKMLTVLIAMLLYVGLAVLILYDAHFWHLSLLKDTLFWFVGVALILLFNVNKATENDAHFLKHVFLEAIAFTVVIVFITNFYAFPLWVEIILYPSIAFMVLLASFASTDEKYSSVKSFFEWVLVLFGSFLLGFGIYQMAVNHQTFFTYDTLRTFLLPILLTIAYLLFLYVCAVYMDYDELFIQIDLSVGDDMELSRWLKRRLVRTCHLNLKRLNSVKSRKSEFRRIRDKSDMLQLLDGVEKS